MLITSVLNILDRTGPDSNACETVSEKFQPWLDRSLLDESAPEKQHELHNEAAGVAGRLPADIQPETQTGRQAMENFIRALEEVKKEERSPLLDVFE